jgi:hypothetical protein
MGKEHVNMFRDNLPTRSRMHARSCTHHETGTEPSVALENVFPHECRSLRTPFCRMLESGRANANASKGHAASPLNSQEGKAGNAMNKIEHYAFGTITINGRLYKSDVLVYPDGRVDDGWWRSEGHRLGRSDIQAIIDSRPDVIIAGTGAYGMMAPAKELAQDLQEAGIQLVVRPTGEAVDIYNTMVREHNVAACLHLTC